MKKIRLGFTLILLCGIFGFAQEITLISKQYGYPMDNVSVISKEGNLVAVSDENGKIVLGEEAANEQYFLLDHYQITSDTLLLNQVKNNAFLVNDAVQLAEITAVGDPKDFIVLEGYFTTSVSSNGTMQAFADGMAQIIIKRKTNRVKKTKVLQYRFYKIESENENRKKVSSVVFDRILDPPSLKFLKKFEREHLQSKISVSSRNNHYSIVLNDDGDEDFKIRLFGYDFTGFKDKLSIDSKDSTLQKLNKIQKFTTIGNMKIKHKSEPEYTSLQLTSNFYTQKIYYLDRKEIDFDHVKFRYDESYYFNEFWENQENYSSLQQMYADIFNEKMQLQPNVYH